MSSRSEYFVLLELQNWISCDLLSLSSRQVHLQTKTWQYWLQSRTILSTLINFVQFCPILCKKLHMIDQDWSILFLWVQYYTVLYSVVHRIESIIEFNILEVFARYIAWYWTIYRTVLYVNTTIFYWIQFYSIYCTKLNIVLFNLGKILQRIEQNWSQDWSQKLCSILWDKLYSILYRIDHYFRLWLPLSISPLKLPGRAPGRVSESSES